MHDEDRRHVTGNASTWVECPQSVPLLGNSIKDLTRAHTHTLRDTHTHINAGAPARTPNLPKWYPGMPPFPRLCMTTIADIKPGEGEILVTVVVSEDGIFAAM